MPFTGPRTVLGLLCVTFGVAAPAAAQRLQSGELKLRADLAPYLEIIHEYRRGQVETAVDQLLVLDIARVSAGVDALLSLGGDFQTAKQPGPAVLVFVGHLASPPQSPDDIDLADIETAALLHTDAAYRAWFLQQNSGKLYHLNAAIRLVEWLRQMLVKLKFGRPRIDASLPRLNFRDWYLATARALTGMSEIDLALAVLKKSLELYPDDSELWLASGTAHEYIARVLTVSLDTTPSPSKTLFFGTVANKREVLQARQAAERDFQKALAIDPSSIEPRLRLGRVLAQTDRGEQAETEFRAVLAATEDAYFRYLASMYLGRVLELRKQVGLAADLYRAAVKLRPDCQACRVALAHALDTLADPNQARVELMSFLRVVAPKSDTVDGWWIYPYGRVEDVERAMNAMRLQVRFK